MWMLTHLHTGDKLYLIPEVQKYTVGRAGSNIVLRDDTSISRSHAIIIYADGSLKLEDTGSKYGTYHNENIANKTKISKGVPIELKEGDRILFGVLKNEWIISKINISTMTSALSSPHTTAIQSCLSSLGGKLIFKWEPSCTHLTMSEITITIKVLHALIEKIPIVSCEYWKDYVSNVKEQKPPPNVSLYLPKPSALLSSAIHIDSFDFNEKRKTLFAGKTFVFMARKHYDMYSQIVKKAGGECKDLKSNIHKTFFLQKNVIIIQYVPSTQSQGSQTVNTITEFLETHSIRTIPEYEIGLAIVCCTTEKYCNPTYNTISHVLPNSPIKTPNIGTILAENTRSQKSQIDIISELDVVEITDSEFPLGKTVQSNVMQSEIYEEKMCESDFSSGEKDRPYRIPKSNDLSDTNDTPRCDSVALNSKHIESVSKCKRRRKSDIDEGHNITKKMHLLQESDERVNLTETCDRSSNFKNVVLPDPNRSKECELVTENTKKPFKTKRNKITGNLGFLQKSQIAAPDKATAVNTTEGTKRGRIACITENDSDEDDIFNFGPPANKRKTTNYNSDDELFAFGNKAAEEDTEDTGTKLAEDVLPQTEPFIAKNNTRINNVSKIKISPVKPSSEGWLSKLSMMKIEAENDTKNEIKCDSDDPHKKDWIDSIKRGFEVRIRKMNLSTKENTLSKLQSSSNSTLNSSKKNFKTFVKKNNYKPQTLIIQTSRR